VDPQPEGEAVSAPTRAAYTPIVGTLGYVLSPDRRRVLLVHRNARKEDQHLGKYNGLGGKMHADEDVAACMRRELHEEAGIEATALVLRGTINWTGFGPHGEDWLGFIFRIDAFEGTPAASCEEGDLLWVPIEEMDRLPMWEGDRHFLPLVFDDDPRAFHGVMPYENDRPLSWSYARF
jgi:8-oxo-dGTP diphosphatase